jgi:hypothetical protein
VTIFDRLDSIDELIEFIIYYLCARLPAPSGSQRTFGSDTDYAPGKSPQVALESFYTINWSFIRENAVRKAYSKPVCSGNKNILLFDNNIDCRYY